MTRHVSDDEGPNDCGMPDTGKHVVHVSRSGETDVHIAWKTEPEPSPGAQPEDVLHMVRGRLAELDDELHDDKTMLAIDRIDRAIAFLERRREDRRKRGVEGTRQP